MRRIALLIALLAPLVAQAGAQKYEPLSDSVRAALSSRACSALPTTSGVPPLAGLSGLSIQSITSVAGAGWPVVMPITST